MAHHGTQGSLPLPTWDRPWGAGAGYFLTKKHFERFGTWQGCVSWGRGRAGLWAEFQMSLTSRENPWRGPSGQGQVLSEPCLVWRGWWRPQRAPELPWGSERSTEGLARTFKDLSFQKCTWSAGTCSLARRLFLPANVLVLQGWVPASTPYPTVLGRGRHPPSLQSPFFCWCPKPSHIPKEGILCLWLSLSVPRCCCSGVSVCLSVAHPQSCAGSVAGSDWKAVNQEPFLSTRYTIPNLSSGDKIHVRVTAVSASGASVPATLEQPVLIREILREYCPRGHDSCGRPLSLPAAQPASDRCYCVVV